ncbi:hypothetical protein ScPMuIL_012627 [Solemya velum]
MISNFNFLILLVLSGISCAWLSSKNSIYSGWSPNRRSSYCMKTGGECLQTSQCCYEDDICMADYNMAQYTGGKLGICRDVRNMHPGNLPEGSNCEDSSECYDLCCRAVRRHRYGVVQTCGKASSFLCITRSKGLNSPFFT